MVGATIPSAARAAARMPDVYFEHRWQAEAARPALNTGIPAFIGFAARARAAQGSAQGWRLLRHWEEFDHGFPGVPFDSYLRHAVHGFFANGGIECVVVPAGAGGQAPAAMAAALTAPLRPGGLLEDIGAIDLVCVPDLMLLATGAAATAVYEVQNAVLEHCGRLENRFAILDALPDGTNPSNPGGPATAGPAALALQQWEALVSNNGALYFPWVRVSPLRYPVAGLSPREPAVPDAAGETVRVPPCGHVAGVYARTDLRAGPHQAPANELLHQVVQLDQNLSNEQYAALNDKGVNCLRQVPGRGIRVWGARTLSGEPGWRYVNVRRLFLSFTRWVEQNCKDLVFEANNPQLWERLAQRLRGYCRTLLDGGALAGTSPADAFHVKCDAETNPPAGIAAGIVVAEVALAPLVPAEFIVVRITQNAGGGSAGVPSGIQ
jgi:hypothetical protein